jgi:hypothetical protein
MMLAAHRLCTLVRLLVVMISLRKREDSSDCQSLILPGLNRLNEVITRCLDIPCHVASHDTPWYGMPCCHTESQPLTHLPVDRRRLAFTLSV